MWWRIIVLLLKPVILVAMFSFVSRFAELTGLQISVVEPAAIAIARLTGVPVNGAAVLIIGAVAVASMRLLTAVANVAMPR